jgi:glycosyltransferase involved in cell wall biosynthesis
VRVLYLNPCSQEVSGPDESLRGLLAELIPAGVKAHVVLPAPGPQVDRYRALGAEVSFAPLAVLSREIAVGTAAFPIKLARSTAAVRRIARDWAADAIHTNMEVLLEGGLAARALRIPHVLHYRGNTLDRPKWVFDGLTWVWTTTADHVYCISGATAEVFRRRHRDRDVEVLYNPVALARFAGAERSEQVRRELGATGASRLVGTVGRLHPRKDLKTFIRAAAHVASRVPDARFAIVGAAEAPVERTHEIELRALARDLGIEPKLTFAGSRRDIPEVMAALDVFVLSSRHEGFGRVVGEAMAAGRPVVVSDEGALPELVDRGRYGYCARAGDAEDFGALIERLLRSPQDVVELTGRARERARDFDAGVIAARVLRRYEQLCATRPITRSARPSGPAP